MHEHSSYEKNHPQGNVYAKTCLVQCHFMRKNFPEMCCPYSRDSDDSLHPSSYLTVGMLHHLRRLSVLCDVDVSAGARGALTSWAPLVAGALTSWAPRRRRESAAGALLVRPADTMAG